MKEKITISLGENEIRKILTEAIEAKGYKVKELEILVRGREGDIQIPKGAIGDCVGAHAEVLLLTETEKQ